MLPPLERFCDRQGLYLDHQKRSRQARRGRKVRWEDSYGNHHDLDFVIERNGSDDEIGQPVGFIEVAWRRYTKHSRNKAQEIQGAILPLAEKYRWTNPFLGAVLAGVFTSGSIEQLRSLGFQVLYFPYETLISAFSSEAIDIQFDESTPDEDFRACVEKISEADEAVVERIKGHLVRANSSQIAQFFDVLNTRLGRSILRILVIPPYGRINEFVTIKAALDFLDMHPIYEGSGEFRKYEILVEFSNGDKVDAHFSTKEKVRAFLSFVATQ